MKSPRARAPRTQPRMIGSLESCLDAGDGGLERPVSTVAPIIDDVLSIDNVNEDLMVGEDVVWGSVKDVAREEEEEVETGVDLMMDAESEVAVDAADMLRDRELVEVVEVSNVEEVKEAMADEAAASEAADTAEPMIEVT